MKEREKPQADDHTGQQTVFLHIGMSKAGSSAIQQALIANAPDLNESGICYPETGRRWGNAHHKILHDLREGGAENLLAKALKEAAHRKAIVFSCEGFWVVRDEIVEVLCRRLAEYDVRVILYLRKPSDYVPSSYRQSIKHDGETCTPEVYWRRGPPWPHLNYSDQLKRWGRCFSLRVRAYEAVKHGIEEDFMRTIGAPVQHMDTQRRLTNPTPSDGAIRLMLLANRYLPEVVSNRVRRWVQRSSWCLNFMPAIDDSVLRKQARTVVSRWDVDVMREYLPQDDLKLLLADGNASSMAALQE